MEYITKWFPCKSDGALTMSVYEHKDITPFEKALLLKEIENAVINESKKRTRKTDLQDRTEPFLG